MNNRRGFLGILGGFLGGTATGEIVGPEKEKGELVGVNKIKEYNYNLDQEKYYYVKFSHYSCSGKMISEGGTINFHPLEMIGLKHCGYFLNRVDDWKEIDKKTYDKCKGLQLELKEWSEKENDYVIKKQ